MTILHAILLFFIVVTVVAVSIVVAIGLIAAIAKVTHEIYRLRHPRRKTK